MSGISRSRVVIGVAGSVLAGFGAFRLVSEVPLRDLVVLGVWLGAAVVVHDAVLSPAILGLGVLVLKVPARARTFVQGGLVAGGLVTAIAIPLILRAGSQPRAKALLEQDVGANLAMLLGVITAVAGTAYLLRLARGRHPSGSTTPVRERPTRPKDAR